MKDNAGKYYIYNGKLLDTAVDNMPDSSGRQTVYEVIRLINGVPLFLEDHYERMGNSMEKTGAKLHLSCSELAGQICSAAKANDNMNCNVKVMIISNEDHTDTLLYNSKSFYPDKHMFESGVSVGLLQLERQNPNVKLINNDYRETADRKMREGNFFEVLLYSRDGSITEGSKSNVFFVKGNKIFTSPGTHVLMGITRKYVIEACRTAGYEVTEAFTHVDTLEEVDGIFLSGTSIKVLPVANVEQMTFKSSVNPVVQAVGREYDKILNKYIEANVKIW